MSVLSKEHYELMEMFEKTFWGRMDREPKDFWSRGQVYQNGEVNELFKAFRQGYAYGRTV